MNDNIIAFGQQNLLVELSKLSSLGPWDVRNKKKFKAGRLQRIYAFESLRYYSHRTGSYNVSFFSSKEIPFLIVHRTSIRILLILFHPDHYRCKEYIIRINKIITLPLYVLIILGISLPLFISLLFSPPLRPPPL